jgi:succinoglycan biosynthesis protein ExoL
MGAGVQVQAFTMRRGPPDKTDWPNVDLGETRDAAFAQRVLALAVAAPVVSRHREALRAADIFYARNLDMLALARWAKAMSGSSARLVYECLDVHRFMARDDLLGATMRSIERRLLRHVSLVVVSSPAFVREYFDKRHPGLANTYLVENRLPPGFAYGPRPSAPPLRAPDAPLRIGWFGNLRCRRSLSLLLSLADRFPRRVEIELRGIPARTELRNFESDIEGRTNVRFAGRYDWPSDLANIYAGVDMVWAGDFHDPSANSRWLLPNRIYEGGYYATPPLAPEDCETGRWIKRNDFGFVLPEPLEQSLPSLVERFDLGALSSARARLLAAPESVFVQPAEELAGLIAAALR